MRELVTIQKIDALDPIPGAEKIEVATIKGWQVVVQKEIHKVGDKIVYYEIDSFLPVLPIYDFLLKGSSPKKMLVNGEEKEGIRLKTIKLRGQVSQGLILPLTAFEGDILDDLDFGTNVTELLGVLKYEPPMPAELVGKIIGYFPPFIPKTDEERIQNMPEVLTGFYVTEKLDGTSVTYFKKDGVFGVCSRNLQLAEGETTQWRLAKGMKLPEILPDNFAFQGELVGEGIQGNPLKIKGHKVYFFNAYNIASGIYLNYQDFRGIVEGLGFETVPIVVEDFALPNSIDRMLNCAEGKSLINPEAEREGIVVRPKTEMQYKGQRLSFKAISNKYLLETES